MKHISMKKKISLTKYSFRLCLAIYVMSSYHKITKLKIN